MPYVGSRTEGERWPETGHPGDAHCSVGLESTSPPSEECAEEVIRQPVVFPDLKGVVFSWIPMTIVQVQHQHCSLVKSTTATTPCLTLECIS
jgi:hypothetical protein